MAGIEEEGGTPLDEAIELSRPGLSALGAAERDDEDEDDDEGGLDFDDDDEFLDDDDDFDEDGPLRTGAKRRAEQRATASDRQLGVAGDPDIADLNNPDVVNLNDPPLLGARGVADMYGSSASTFGRATSPRLYASAGQHPNCTQIRVWRMENGIPVGLGPIDAEATEEDLVRVFYTAMPKPGEGRFQFRCRPIDQRGNELGTEFIVNISEHNVALRNMRMAEQRRMMEQYGMGGMMPGMMGMPGMGLMPGMGMGMWGQQGQQRGPGGDVIVQGGNADTAMAEEMGRMFETAVTAAEDQTKHLQATLEMERERLREEERSRAAERVAMAERASTTTEKMMERLMGSDRQRSEEAMQAQRQHSDLLMTTLTTVFQQQQEASRQQSERMREADSIRLQQDREYFARQRDEAEQRRREEREEYERKRQAEIEQQRIEAQRREAEIQSRRDLEKEEARLRLEREKMDLEARREELRLERERARQEAEERRQRETMEFERKMQLEREERERRERADRERWERERAEQDRKRDEERREWERREQLRREEMSREAERRREEMALQMKQMEMQAQRDREHSERMAEQARLEREQQRESAERREKIERDLREAADRERQRQYELQKFEMQQQKERDREHAERMMQLQKIQSSGLGGLTEMLGMETPELLGRLFGGGDDEGGWADAIPKMLGGIGELGKAIMAGQAAQAQSGTPQGRTPRADTQQRIPIQTPQGVKMITVDQLRELQARQAAQQAALPAPAELPSQGFVPSVPKAEQQPVPTVVPEEEEGDELSEDYKAGLEVDTTQRAKAAGLSLKDMRNARKALRSLAVKLDKSGEDAWEGIVAAALMTEASVLPYVTAVSAYAAFAETKAEPALVERVITMLKESPAVPDGAVPFNEADLAALNEPATEPPAPASAPPKPELPAGAHAKEK